MKNNVLPLLKLALPLVITGLVQSSVWFFETIFLAQLSPEILAAGSLVSWSFGTVVVILFGTLSSINILIAHKHGAKDEQGIYQIVRDGFWLALICAIPIFLLFWNMAPLFLIFGQSPAVVQLAENYLHAMAWGILPNVIIIALLEMFMGIGRTRIIMICNTFTVIVTIFLSYTLIFGKFGLPMLGIAGAGWALTISNWISVFCIGAYALTSTRYKRYFSLLLHFTKPSYLTELLSIGLPMGIMFCVEVTFFFALTLVMGSFGSLVMAANQIALQYLGTLMAVVFSIAQAITVRMGHLLGAGDKVAAEKSAYVGLSLSAFFMLLVALVCWCFPTYLIALDFDVHNPKNAEIVFFARQFLIVGAFFQIFEAVRISFFGALRSLKDTHFTLFVSIFSFWCVALPVGYLFATRLGLGEVGLWWGMTLGAFLSVLILLWRFRYKIKTY